MLMKLFDRSFRIFATCTREPLRVSALRSVAPAAANLSTSPSFPANLPSCVIGDLEKNGIAVVPDYATPDAVDTLRKDALQLRSDGRFRSAVTRSDARESGSSGPPPTRRIRACHSVGLVNERGSEIERNDDLRASFARTGPDRGPTRARPRFDGPPFVGQLCSMLEGVLDGISPYSDSEEYLHDFPPEAAEQNGVHIHQTEVSYLFYDKGGYYDRHVDTPNTSPGSKQIRNPSNSEDGKHRRAFSFLLYLGGATPRAGWTEEAGGALRIYERLSSADQRCRGNGVASESLPESSRVGTPAGTEVLHEILPHEGTLVLFKSEAMCHDVAVTHRERLALVGWIHGNIPMHA